MKKAIVITLGVLGILVLAGGLLFTGMVIGRGTGWVSGWFRPAKMMNGYSTGNGYGMMNGSGYGMMNRSGGYGMMGSGRGYGMMYGYGSSAGNTTPLTLDQAYKAAENYLANL